MDRAYIVEQLMLIVEKFGLDISEDAISRAVGFSEFKVYSKGQLLGKIGEGSSVAGIVMSGVVRSFYVDSDGNDITQYFASEGSLCIDEGLMGFNERVAMWESLEESTVMLFKASDMKDLILGDEHLKTVWIGLLEEALRYKIYRENGFLVENATERYLAFRKRSPELASRIPQRYIATYLGIKPESLSRIRSALKEEEEQ